MGFLGSYATHDRTCAWVTGEKPGDLHIRLWISRVGIKGMGITLLKKGESTRRSPNLVTLTETGQGSEEEDPQRESLHDEEGQQAKSVRRSAPT